MANETITDPTTSLADRRRSLFRHAECLPGFDAFVADHPDIGKYISEQWRLVEAAVRDDDLSRFEDSAGSWLKACHRVNELVAEVYRAAHADPEAWELRYLKWMAVTFIRLESPAGEFFVVPRRPRRRPKAKHWYTVDEILGMMEPGVAHLIGMTGKLPMRPEDLPRPAPNEKHLHMDFTGPTLDSYYVFGGNQWRNATL